MEDIYFACFDNLRHTLAPLMRNFSTYLLLFSLLSVNPFTFYFVCVCVYHLLFFQEYVFSKSSLSRDQITAMHSTSIGDVDDMARLGDLHEASILNNLAKRYKKDTIYVSVAKVSQ